MAIKLWSKLESDNDVTSPQIGSAGTVVGSPTYEAVKFGNGILVNADGEGCYFPNSMIPHSKGALEFWLKLDWEMVNGASPADTQIFFDVGEEAGNRLTLYADASSLNLRVVPGGYIANDTTTDKAANAVFHIGVTWDNTGSDIGSSKTLRITVDDVETASVTDTWTAGSFTNNLYLGVYAADQTLHLDGRIDNIKIYDHCKLDFSDRNVESSYGLVNAPFFGCNF